MCFVVGVLFFVLGIGLGYLQVDGVGLDFCVLDTRVFEIN